MAQRRTRRRSDRPSGRSMRLMMVSTIVVGSGLLYLMAGMTLLLQPEWFFENVAPFAPYNRLLLGQLGSLLLPLGVAMIVASQNPVEKRMMIAAGLGAAILLGLNQWYGISLDEVPPAGWLTSVLPLLLLAGMLGWAFWQVRPRLRRR